MAIRRIHRRHSEAGFSLVELLLAAFIMAVGLLGLAALETASLKSNNRSRGYNTAVLVAGHVLDAAEIEGRQSSMALVFGAAAPAYTPNYFGAAAVNEQFTYRGRHLDATAVDPVDKTAFFTAKTTAVTPAGVTSPAASGSISVVTTVVTFQEASYPGGPTVTRTVTLTRNISHA